MIKRKPSYQIEKNHLTGTYRDSFCQIEDYCKERGLSVKDRELFLKKLVRQFIQIQEEAKPVESIVGNNMQRFCRTQMQRNFPFHFIDVLCQNLIVIGILAFTLTGFMAFYNQFTGQILNAWKGWWTASTFYLALYISIVVGVCYYLSVRRLIPLAAQKTSDILKKLYLILPLAIFVFGIIIGGFSLNVAWYRVFYVMLPISIAGVCGLVATRVQIQNSRIYRRQPNQINATQKEIYERKCEIHQLQIASRTGLVIFCLLLAFSLWEYYINSSMDMSIVGAITVLLIGMSYFVTKLSNYTHKIQFLEVDRTNVDK